MAPKKRPLDDASSASTSKKAKGTPKEKSLKSTKSSASAEAEFPAPTFASSIIRDEVDFVRGGGTSFTPFEVKTIQREGLEEADKELFKERIASKKKRKSDKKAASNDVQGTIRVEHLNYKRLTPGMKVLGQLVTVQPLGLVVSLPNQLLGHVPITNITSQLTARLEKLDEDAERGSDVSMDDGVEVEESSLPNLEDLFKPGQYVRAVVMAVHSQGTSFTGLASKSRDGNEKNSRRVELSLEPEKVNAGIVKADLKTGMVLPAAIKSVEDHGYILDLGIDGASGFLPISNVGAPKPEPGALLDVTVTQAASNGRIFTCSADAEAVTKSHISDISSVSSVIPGLLVQGLITAILPSGLNMQILGFLEGTVDEYHVELGREYQIGQKVKARILYQSNQSTPPKFALSLAEHVIKLTPRTHRASDAEEGLLAVAFPIGTILETVQVRRVEPERGLVVEVEPGLLGFVHISHVSDDHVPTLSANGGPWKVGTIHRARVTGYLAFDGLLQLSCRASVLEQKFLQVSDMAVGTLVKGTIKNLTDNAMFVSLSGSVDGVVWPNHYADIALKHPAKRFRPGGSIKCRVLAVDPERNRISLTAKKTLVDSTLPLVSSWDSVQIGIVTHAVVFKVGLKSLQIEFYNNLKGIVPIQEASESFTQSLADTFSVGKPIKVRIISVDVEGRKIVASIRQAINNLAEMMQDVSEVDVGNVVEGVVADIHKDNVVLSLQPTQIRALLSLNNLANKQGTTVAKLRSSLAKGQTLQDLLVVSKNAEKGFVIVASKPKKADSATTNASTTWDTVQLGQTIHGRVIGHSSKGSLIKIGHHTIGLLHPTDCSDDYSSSVPFPEKDSAIKAVVISMDKEKKQLYLSTRASRLSPSANATVTDPEIQDLTALKPGQAVRGFVKNVADHGVFVYVARNIDARVQIKELFDDYVKDWQPRFQVNQVVKGRILSLNAEKHQLELTFRSGARAPTSSRLTLSDLSVGQKVEGKVKKVADYGMFIQIDGGNLSGLCHKSQLSDNAHADVALALRSFHEGDPVKAVILSIDEAKRQISLGLKPSYFDKEDFDVPDDTSSSEEELGVEEIEADGDNLASGDEDMAVLEDFADHESSDEDEDDVVIMKPSHAPAMHTTTPATVTSTGPDVTPLQLGSGFQWSASAPPQLLEDMDSSSDSETEGAVPHRTKRRRKEIEQDLTADMHTKLPQSIADFERVLLGSPNSSFLWIQYMSFQLQLAEVDKAREVARRALRTINFREEQEKMNVWIAMLNLENVYGTDDTLEAVFKEAARANDSKTVHLRLATILNESSKTEKAQELYQRTCKKFGRSSKVWCLFGEYYMGHGKLEDARKLLPRSMQSLEKRKHLKTISRFAQMEYKLGEPERGRTIFEGIIDSHPKRLDLWSVYIDMEATQNDMNHIRQLFHRALSLKLTNHKAKSLFKKWLELERRLGDEEGQNQVKERAIAWTQQASQA